MCDNEDNCGDNSDENQTKCGMFLKTGHLGFRPGPTQTGLYSYRRLLEAGNFAF